MEKGLWSVQEAAEYLNIGKTKLYSLIKRGMLKPIRIDKKTLFDPADLKKFIEDLKKNS